MSADEPGADDEDGTGPAIVSPLPTDAAADEATGAARLAEAAIAPVALHPGDALRELAGENWRNIDLDALILRGGFMAELLAKETCTISVHQARELGTATRTDYQFWCRVCAAWQARRQTPDDPKAPRYLGPRLPR